MLANLQNSPCLRVCSGEVFCTIAGMKEQMPNQSARPVHHFFLGGGEVWRAAGYWLPNRFIYNLFLDFVQKCGTGNGDYAFLRYWATRFAKMEEMSPVSLGFPTVRCLFVG